MTLSPAYVKAVGVAFALQLPVLLLSSAILDGGFVFKTTLCATGGFWCGVLLIAGRRPQFPRADDLVFIRIGFFPLLIIAFAIVSPTCAFAQRFRGN